VFNEVGDYDMKRRHFNRFALGIALSPILANAQVAGRTEAFAQPPSENVVANDPMAAVRKYVDAFNRSDAAVMATTFAIPGSILDGMAPHVWQGPTATQDWYRDVLLEGKQHGASDYFITLGEPLHNNVTGDSLCRRSRDHDVQSARRAGYANRRSIYSGASQARRRVADSGLGLGERHPSITSMHCGQTGHSGRRGPSCCGA
jgi:hypothetical protein